jgi:hypothetical protein
VKKARETAIDILQTAFEGTDVRAARNEALTTRSANTMEGVARRFIEQDAKPNIASWRQVERALELHVFPEWGQHPITSDPMSSEE